MSDKKNLFAAVSNETKTKVRVNRLQQGRQHFKKTETHPLISISSGIEICMYVGTMKSTSLSACWGQIQNRERAWPEYFGLG
jgi:hypothetical protein